jgi:hypothetical protein
MKEDGCWLLAQSTGAHLRPMVYDGSMTIHFWILIGNGLTSRIIDYDSVISHPFVCPSWFNH